MCTYHISKINDFSNIVNQTNGRFIKSQTERIQVRYNNSIKARVFT